MLKCAINTEMSQNNLIILSSNYCQNEKFHFPPHFVIAKCIRSRCRYSIWLTLAKISGSTWKKGIFTSNSVIHHCWNKCMVMQKPQICRTTCINGHEEMTLTSYCLINLLWSIGFTWLQQANVVHFKTSTKINVPRRRLGWRSAILSIHRA